ncbi:hypothetical protein I552_2229 [Mycobacterium xenopi 3993]|nr:hypothetical protein I552_2229 [Mycobacterium xenopi 3993]
MNDPQRRVGWLAYSTLLPPRYFDNVSARPRRLCEADEVAVGQADGDDHQLCQHRNRRG